MANFVPECFYVFGGGYCAAATEDFFTLFYPLLCLFGVRLGCRITVMLELAARRIFVTTTGGFDCRENIHITSQECATWCGFAELR